jgi:excisionase family DNA binding protein
MKPEVPVSPRSRKPSALPLLYSVGMVAEMLNVSPRTVRRWISAGLLPVHRLGRQLRISDPDLVAFVARSRCF